jgi:hypothetical protein
MRSSKLNSTAPVKGYPTPGQGLRPAGRALSKSGGSARHGAGGAWCPPTITEETVMQYLLMIHASEAGWSNLTPTQQAQGAAAYGAYTEALKKAGVLVGSNRLQPTQAATTVRNVNGKAQVLNGPYAESKEQLGGYYLIDVPDLDAALSWAARCPGADHGAIEVRPIWAM